jgi:carbon-monoxide dehydrogenase medium subunit
MRREGKSRVSLNGEDRLYVARSLPDALAALADRGNAGAPLAGATWIMRAPIRQERLARSYVAISKIDELRHVEILDSEIKIGACVTHAALAASLAPLPECRALAQAAANSANPAVREVATIGGNLCAAAFAASDMAPALICLDAAIDVRTPGGSERMSVERFLAIRTSIEPSCLVRSVVVPRAARRSVHMRLPLRKAGDYPVAIVSLAAMLDPNGLVEKARVAVGSIEPAARRWNRLEAELIGHRLAPERAAEKAGEYAADFRGRDGVEAPGWYRVKVLASLVRRAVQALQENA